MPQTAMVRADHPEPRLPRQVGGAVRRSVVDDDHLEVRVVELQQPLEAVAESPLAVARAHHNRYARPPHARREGNPREGAADGVQRRLWTAIAPCDAKLPILDVGPRAVPLVRPRKNESARAPGRKARPDLPVENAGLAILPMSKAVDAELGQDERTVARDVLEPPQIRLQAGLRLETDVERDEVQERKLQILGGRVIDVCDERVAVLVLDRAVEPLEVPLDLLASVPPDERGRDLVAKRVAEERRMAGAHAGLLAHPPLDLAGVLSVNEKADVLLGRQADHDPKPVALRGVEKRARRNGMRDPHAVQAACRDLCEVALDDLEVPVLLAVRVRPERPVRNAPDVKLLIAREHELATNVRPDDGGGLSARSASRGTATEAPKAHVVGSSLGRRAALFGRSGGALPRIVCRRPWPRSGRLPQRARTHPAVYVLRASL
jgi:hypothetical protein